MNMYSASCPDCGAIIHTNVGGLIWAGCPLCPFYGQVLAMPRVNAPPPTFPPLAPGISNGTDGAFLAKLAQAQSAPVSATDPHGGLTVGGVDVGAFAEEVYLALVKLPLSDQTQPLPPAWDGVQRALDTLYEALGGARHLGDYAPDVDAVGEAIIGVTTRLLLTLFAVGHMHEMEGE
jgi:hypothetical protein